MTLEKLLTELTEYAAASKAIYELTDDEQSFGEYVAYSTCIKLLQQCKELQK